MIKRSMARLIPQRVRDWREARQLEKDIEEINERFRPRIAAARTQQEEHNVDEEWTHEVEEYHDSLGLLKTKRLVKLANRWEVDIPQDAWTDDRYESFRYIYSGAQVKLRRNIRDARRETVRWWVQILMPPLSLIVALVALLTTKC